MTDPSQPPRVQVNPIACVAAGMCVELLPERISLDEWGYPIVNGDPLPAELVTHARRAVAACPTLALRVDGKLSRLRS
jgi:ferredoxin